MLAFGGDLRKSKAIFGNGGCFLNRSNFQEYGERFSFFMG
jgi:hypothetical protein